MDHSVDRCSFREISLAARGGFDALNRATTTEDCLDSPCRLRLFQNRGHPGVNPWIIGEIGFNKNRRFALGDTQPTGQAICTEAIDDPKVHRFCLATLLVGDIRLVYSKNLGCNNVMDIATSPECFQKICILTEVGQHSKLDLAVVGCE